jgi:hypothetical protein
MVRKKLEQSQPPCRNQDHRRQDEALCREASASHMVGVICSSVSVEDPRRIGPEIYVEQSGLLWGPFNFRHYVSRSGPRSEISWTNPDGPSFHLFGIASSDECEQLEMVQRKWDLWCWNLPIASALITEFFYSNPVGLLIRKYPPLRKIGGNVLFADRIGFTRTRR